MPAFCGDHHVCKVLLIRQLLASCTGDRGWKKSGCYPRAQHICGQDMAAGCSACSFISLIPSCCHIPKDRSVVGGSGLAFIAESVRSSADRLSASSLSMRPSCSRSSASICSFWPRCRRQNETEGTHTGQGTAFVDAFLLRRGTRFKKTMSGDKTIDRRSRRLVTRKKKED